jgi:hypothetical protein
MKLRKTKAHKQHRGGAARTSRSPQTNVQLQGFWLSLARGVWISFVLVELLVLILSLVATRGESYSICPFLVDCTVSTATAQVLHHVSIAPSNYASYNLGLALLQALVFLSVGGFIFWRKSSEPIALVASIFFVSIGLAPFFPPTPPSTYQPEVIFSNIYGLCVFTALGFFLVTFPDGRFVPRWSWSLVVLWLVLAGFNEVPGPYNINSWPPLLNAAVEVLIYGGTLGVLIYRYVRVFSSSQRQQAKWLLYGFGGVFVLIILYDIIGSLVPGLGAPDSFYQLANGTLTTLTFLFLPLSIGIAILRAKLWDIDVLIRRTIVYSTLTVILVLIYVGLILVFGTLLRQSLGQEENPLVIVVSTLVIAALFQPLRHGIQRVIDRRFYRKKYDAAKTLEAFSATLRNEVDLSQLQQHLLTVVQETMQPAHVSLWLRSSEHDGTHQFPWRANPPVYSNDEL